MRPTTSLCVLSALALGCGGGSDGDSAGNGPTGPAACEQAARDVNRAFAPLPAGFKYARVPAANIAKARKEAGEDYRTIVGRLVQRGGTTVAVVLGQVLVEPIKDEDTYFRGFGKGLGARREADEVRLGAGEGRRFETPGGTAMVRREGECTIVAVVAPERRTAERVAEAISPQR